jgi:hypothetical protein
MGKKKENISRFNKKYEVEQYLNDSDNEDDINHENDINNEEQKKNYMNETAIIIRQNILDYVDNGGYSLAEYLDIVNVENYLKFLIDKC